MKNAPGRQRLCAVQLTIGLLGTAMLLAPVAMAQNPPPDSKAGEAKAGPETYQTLYLSNVTQQSDLGDIQTAIRNMLPRAKIYGSPSQGALSIEGTPEDIRLAAKIIADLDKPRKLYRLTFSIAETDGGKRVGTQRFSLLAASGEKTILKEGSRVPVVTGSFDNDASKRASQYQYVDVGLSIEASVEGYVDGLKLRSKVEQSSVSDEKAPVGIQDPVLRQTTLEGAATLALGKPIALGSLDIPGTTRHQDVEVVAEIVR